MRKCLLLFVISLSSINSFAQDDAKTAVKKTIERFFEGFHAQDSLIMKEVVYNQVVLQTTAQNKDGQTVFKTDEISALYKNIVAIPKTVNFNEKLISWDINVDRTMANAWVGYEFWLNGSLSHCGVNAFQLVNFNGLWKIVYLIDTRDKEGCE